MTEKHPYLLSPSPTEVNRYRLMAAAARAEEETDWIAAGAVRGARVADVGCGPAAVAVLLADVVGPTGRVDAVDRDPDALALAAEVVADAEAANVGLTL
nr:methyltransferase domain-containing protein [Micromonospora sp. DSM 115978]